MSDFFRVIFSQRVVSSVLIFLAFLISILMLLLPSQRGVSGLNSPVEGQVIPQMVYAAVDFRTIDWKAQTEPQRQDYLLQKHRSESIRTAVAGYCSELGDKLKGPHHAEAEKLGKLLLNPENWKRFSTRFEGEVLNSGILPAEVQKTACKLYVIPEGDGTLVYGPKQYDSMTQERAAEKTAALLCDLFYVGNGKTAFQTALAKELLPCFEDGNLQIRISEEQNIVRPEQVIYAGTLLLKKGERLTKEDITLLEDHRKALEERKAEQNSSLNKIQKILLAALFMVFTSLYMRAVYPKIMHRQQLGLVISFVTLLALIANLLAGTFFRHVSNETNILQSLIFLSLPLAFPSLLLSTVFGLRSGIFVGLYIAGITAIYLDQSFPVLLTGLLVSGIAGSFVRNCRDYKKFFMTGLVTVTLTTFICGATFLLNVCDDMACLPHLRDVAILSFGTGMVTPLLALLVLFLISGVDPPVKHFLHTVFTTAFHLEETVKEEAVYIVLIQNFLHHGFQVFPVRGIITGHSCPGSGKPLFFALFIVSVPGDSIVFDHHPVPVGDQFFIGKPHIEIDTQGDPLFFAASAQFPDHIHFQRGMFFPRLCVVIGIPLIAPGMPGEEIHVAAQQFIRETLRIKISSHIRDRGDRMEIVKKGILEFFHGDPSPLY